MVQKNSQINPKVDTQKTVLNTMRFSIVIFAMILGAIVYYFEGRSEEIGNNTELRDLMNESTEDLKQYIDTRSKAIEDSFNLDIESMERKIDSIRGNIVDMAFEMTEIKHSVVIHQKNPHIDNSYRAVILERDVAEIKGVQKEVIATINRISGNAANGIQ